MHHPEMLTVGAFARISGLPVSALRYYDGVGLLRPAHVDQVTGYRWYTPDQVEHARVVARMRRTGMPLTDIRLLVTTDPVTARRVVDAHERHLEAELAVAKADLADARELLSATMHLTVDAAALRGALTSVRHAVGDHSSWRALHGVLFDVDGADLRLVATDRHRLAATGVPVTGVDGPPMRVIVPVAVVDRFLDRVGTRRVGVSLAADHVLLGDCGGLPIDALYPDYEMLLATHRPRRRPGPRSSDTVGTTVPAPDLLAQVIAARNQPRGGPDRLVLIELDRTEVRFGDATRAVPYDREYLADAVRSFGDADLCLTVGERDAIRLSTVQAPEAVVLLMPVRLDSRAA